MKVKHIFRSGNDCEIDISEDVRTGLLHNTVQWERYPPSDQDLREYREEVLPGKVIPAMAAALRRVKGVGQFVEVRPGIWAWMEAGNRN